MVDAANYMSEKGWNFQQAYTSVYAGNVIQHWIFYKEAETQEEAGKGIMTKRELQEVTEIKENLKQAFISYYRELILEEQNKMVPT